MRPHPVNGGQQFHPEGRFEPLDQPDHPLETLPCVRMILEEVLSLIQTSGKQLDLLVGPILRVSVALDEVALNVTEHMAQFRAYGPNGPFWNCNRRSCPASCMKYMSLWISSSVTDGVHHRREIAVHQADQGGTAGGHLASLELDHGRLPSCI